MQDLDPQTWLDQRRALINLLRVADIEQLDAHTLHTVCDMLEGSELTLDQALKAFE